MLEDVIDHGTGATVRSRGFVAPAAGKTGTSRDGWFAGYTSNLLAIIQDEVKVAMEEME